MKIMLYDVTCIQVNITGNSLYPQLYVSLAHSPSASPPPRPVYC